MTQVHVASLRLKFNQDIREDSSAPNVRLRMELHSICNRKTLYKGNTKERPKAEGVAYISNIS